MTLTGSVDPSHFLPRLVSICSAVLFPPSSYTRKSISLNPLAELALEENETLVGPSTFALTASSDGGRSKRSAALRILSIMSFDAPPFVVPCPFPAWRAFLPQESPCWTLCPVRTVDTPPVAGAGMIGSPISPVILSLRCLSSSSSSTW